MRVCECVSAVVCVCESVYGCEGVRAVFHKTVHSLHTLWEDLQRPRTVCLRLNSALEAVSQSRGCAVCGPSFSSPRPGGQGQRHCRGPPAV